MRIRPSSASAWAALRVFTIRANQRNLSSLQALSHASTPSAPPAPQRRASRLCAASGRRRSRPRQIQPASPSTGRKPMSRISFATVCGQQPERGDQRLVDQLALLAALRLMGVARQPVGHVDADHLAVRRRESRAAAAARACRRPARAGPRWTAAAAPAMSWPEAAARRRAAPAHRLGLQHRRHVQVERADPDAEAGNGAALVPIQRRERLGHLLARDDAAFVDQHGEQRSHRRRRRPVLGARCPPPAAARAYVRTWPRIQFWSRSMTASRPRCRDRIDAAGRAGCAVTADSCRGRAGRPHGRARGWRPACRARCAARNARRCRRPGPPRASHIRRRAAARPWRAASCGRHGAPPGRPRSEKPCSRPIA